MTSTLTLTLITTSESEKSEKKTCKDCDRATCFVGSALCLWVMGWGGRWEREIEKGGMSTGWEGRGEEEGG